MGKMYLTMTCGVYAIFSDLNDDCLYVGQSKDVEARFRQHVSKLKNRRTSCLEKFADWFHSNGGDESLLRCELVEECCDDELTKNALEAKWFDELKPEFYGKTPSLSEKWNHSDETKKRIGVSIANNYAGIREVDKEKTCSFCDAVFFSRKKSSKLCSVRCQQNSKIFVHHTLFPTKELLEKLYVEENRTLRDVAEILGCTHPTVMRLLEKYQISTRKRVQVKRNR